VLTGSADGSARLWDAATGDLRATLAHAEAVNAVAFSPDGSRVLTGCQDHTARLWDAATGHRLGAPLTNRYPVQAVAFHPTQPLLATGSGAGDVRQFGRGETRFWDANGGEAVGVPLADGGLVRAVAFSPNGRLLLTAARDGRARLTDVSRLQPLVLAVRHAPGVRWTRFRPDGKALLTVAASREPGGAWAEMRLWDAATGAPLGPPMPAHTVDPNRTGFLVDFSPDGRALVNRLPDGSQFVREAATGWPLGPPLPERAETGHRIGFRPDATQFYVLRYSTVLHWDATPTAPDGPPLLLEGRVTAAAFRPDGKALLTACGDGTTCLWDLGSRRRLGEAVRRAAPIRALAFAPDGATFLTADLDGTVKRWETRTGRPVGPALPDPEKQYRGHFRSLRFTLDGEYIVTESWQTLYLWEAATGRRVASFRNSGHAWESGGALLGLIAGDTMVGVEGEVRLWDVKRQQFRGFALPQDGRCLDIQPGGCLLATGAERTVALWDVATGKPVGPPLDHPAPLIALNFDPEGRRLLTCCGDETARLWEVPRPVAGGPERVRLWVEVLTGKELDAAEVARALSEPELQRRRRRLQELGDPVGLRRG
jgi:WD40 repeat protein